MTAVAHDRGGAMTSADPPGSWRGAARRMLRLTRAQLRPGGYRDHVLWVTLQLCPLPS
jgi:hypothetical protein